MGKYITVWGKECRKSMIDKGVTLTELSNITGYSRTYISAIINNRMVAPESTKKVIAEALGVDLEFSLAGQEVH